MSSSTTEAPAPSHVVSRLQVTWEHIRQELDRANLTALGCVGLLFGLAGAITQISSIPRVVYPYLVIAAVLSAGVMGTLAWVLWPRGIDQKPELPGSWPHARRFTTEKDLIAAYVKYSAAHIVAGQVLALAPTTHRKWAAVRVMLPLTGSVVVVLLIALIVGLTSA